MKKMKRSLSMLLALVMLLGLVPVTGLAVNHPFADVEEHAWYQTAVQYVYDHGLMNGTGKTKFSPAGTATRAMLVTVLHRMEGEPVASASPFVDVEVKSWYAQAVSWAAANDIVEGVSADRFNPNTDVTREQMATILHRFAAYKGMDVSDKANLSSFADFEKIHAWAADAMAWANACQLITGKSETVLDPRGNATRAQIATILMRFDLLMKDELVDPIDPEPEPEPESEHELISGADGNDYSFNSDLIILPATYTGYIVTGTDDGYHVTVNTGDDVNSLKRDDVVLFPANDSYPGGFAVKLNQDVSVNGSESDLYGEAPDLSEVLSSLDAGGSETASMLSADSFIPAEGVEIVSNLEFDEV